MQEGSRHFRELLCGLATGTMTGLLLTAIGQWGGVTGRTIVCVIGYGVFGAFAPLCLGAEPKSGNQERFMWWVCGLFGVGGIVFGMIAGTDGRETPWWIDGIAILAGVIGGWVMGARGYRWLSKRNAV